MRFGYFVSYGRANEAESLASVFADMREQIECAEAAGFDIIWFPERHFNAAAVIPNPLTAIAAAAQWTTRVRLGTSVIIAPYRHPLIMAEEIGFVDHLTGGRLEVGFARGASGYQYRRFGMADTEAAQRMNESVDIMLKVWGSEDAVEYAGDSFNFPAVSVAPRPLQQPHPPMSLAARSPESLRYCLERNFAIHTTPLRQDISASGVTMDTLKAVAEGIGYTGDLNVAVEIETFIAEERPAIEAAMKALEEGHIRTQNFGRNGREPVRGFGSLEPLPEGLGIPAALLEERCVVGTPARVLEQVRYFCSIGMNEFIAHMDFGQSQQDVLKSIELFGKHIIARDWAPETEAARQSIKAASSSPAAREAHAAAVGQRLGAGWQSWGEAEWLAHLRAGGPEAVEIFDVACAPQGIKAEATGIVQQSGKLYLSRKQRCPVCGRPALALTAREALEAPVDLEQRIAADPKWANWHATHP